MARILSAQMRMSPSAELRLLGHCVVCASLNIQ